jgi:hypothetical protein
MLATPAAFSMTATPVSLSPACLAWVQGTVALLRKSVTTPGFSS